jgi:hypothetical protein
MSKKTRHWARLVWKKCPVSKEYAWPSELRENLDNGLDEIRMIKDEWI